MSDLFSGVWYFLNAFFDQVNGQNVRHSTHQQVVGWLVSQQGNIELLVEHVPQPPGLQVCISVHVHAILLTLCDLCLCSIYSSFM